MHNNKSLSRELTLISLGLIKDKGDLKLNKFEEAKNIFFEIKQTWKQANKLI